MKYGIKIKNPRNKYNKELVKDFATYEDVTRYEEYIRDFLDYEIEMRKILDEDE